jgi:hypothetical protein
MGSGSRSRWNRWLCLELRQHTTQQDPTALAAVGESDRQLVHGPAAQVLPLPHNADGQQPSPDCGRGLGGGRTDRAHGDEPMGLSFHWTPNHKPSSAWDGTTRCESPDFPHAPDKFSNLSHEAADLRVRWLRAHPHKTIPGGCPRHASARSLKGNLNPARGCRAAATPGDGSPHKSSNPVGIPESATLEVPSEKCRSTVQQSLKELRPAGPRNPGC